MLVGGVPVVTITSSNDAVEYNVCRPIRPVLDTELVPWATRLPSIVARTEVPLTSMARVYQVPVATVRDAEPSTVTAEPFTTCSWTWLPGSNASR